MKIPLTCCSGLSVQRLYPGRLIRLQTSHDEEHNVSLKCNNGGLQFYGQTTLVLPNDVHALLQ